MPLPRPVVCLSSILLACIAGTPSSQDEFQPVDPTAVQTEPEQPRAYTGVGRIEFDQTNIDLGEVTSNEAVTAEFRFTNTGEGPIEIAQVRASCGCTTTALPKMRFEPGESEVIRATIKPRRPGVNSSNVTVSFREPDLQPTRLRVRVNYAAPFKLEQNLVRLGNVELGESATGAFTIVSRDQNVDIVSIANPGGLLDIDWEPGQAMPLERVEAPAEASYPYRRTIPFRLKDDLPTGQLREAIVIRAKEQGQENVTTLSAYVQGIVLGDLTTSPAHARLQPSQDDPQTFTSRVEIVSRTGRPFAVKDVRVIGQADAEFTARILPDDAVEGEGTWVEVVATPSITAGVFRGTLEIYTDRGAAPLTTVCVGLVRASSAAATN